MNVQIEEKELYRKYLDGDTEAFADIIKNNKNNLVYFIFKYVKNIDIAEDIFQNVIIYILENKEKYDFRYSFKSYLYIIAKSQCLNYLKGSKREYTNLEDESVLAIEEKMLEDIILSEERKTKIIEVMKKMNLEYQQVIYLTLIEGLSYEDTGKIMDRSVAQIKNLLYRARVKIKKLLIEEKVIELKNNKLIKLLLWIAIIGVISSGTVYATLKIYENLKQKANLTPTFTGAIGNTNYNSIWVGTFNIAWNELIEKYTYKDINFKGGNTTLVNELNRQDFNKNEIKEEDYYVKVGKTSETLKKEIIKEVNEKFALDNLSSLDEIDFKNASGTSITIYTLLNKKFEFIDAFDRVENAIFGNNEQKIKYFGINNASDEKLNNNVEVLFYNNENDFAIKLKTKENEEIILYRIEENNSFDKYYENLEKNTAKYIGSKEFKNVDVLKIPYITIDTTINYDELCGKYIEGENSLYIQNALQNVRFNMNESGGTLHSEAAIKGEVNSFVSEKPRNFSFDKQFVLFLKEKDKQKPYMSLKVDNIEILEVAD